MALIEDMFKGNLMAPVSPKVSAPHSRGVIRAIGNILWPAAKILLNNGWSSIAKLWAKSGKWRPISSPKREPS
jgi:hypothetical protein